MFLITSFNYRIGEAARPLVSHWTQHMTDRMCTVSRETPTFCEFMLQSWEPLESFKSTNWCASLEAYCSGLVRDRPPSQSSQVALLGKRGTKSLDSDGSYPGDLELRGCVAHSLEMSPEFPTEGVSVCLVLRRRRLQSDAFWLVQLRGVMPWAFLTAKKKKKKKWPGPLAQNIVNSGTELRGAYLVGGVVLHTKPTW